MRFAILLSILLTPYNLSSTYALNKVGQALSRKSPDRAFLISGLNFSDMHPLEEVKKTIQKACVHSPEYLIPLLGKIRECSSLLYERSLERDGEYHGQTLLHWTIKYSYLPAACHLITFLKTEELLEKDSYNTTYLLCLADGDYKDDTEQQESLKVVQTLIKKIANHYPERIQNFARTPDHKNRTPFGCSLERKNHHIAEYLLSYIEVEDFFKTPCGKNPIMYAIEENWEYFLSRFMQNSIPEQRDKILSSTTYDKNTPLHLALQLKHISLAFVLLKYSSWHHLLLQDRCRQTPFDLARTLENKELINKILAIIPSSLHSDFSFIV